MAVDLGALSFGVGTPAWESVGGWVAPTVTTYDAVYVASAEESRPTLVADDALVATSAPSPGRGLSPGRGAARWSVPVPAGNSARC